MLPDRRPGGGGLRRLPLRPGCGSQAARCRLSRRPRQHASPPQLGRLGGPAVIALAEAVDLAPSFDGVLAEVRVGPGDLVAAGQVVALLDERPLREELDSALAALRETRARGPRIAVDIRSARRRVQVEQQAVEAGTSARRLLEEARFAFAAAARPAASSPRPSPRSRPASIEPGAGWAALPCARPSPDPSAPAIAPRGLPLDRRRRSCA